MCKAYRLDITIDPHTGEYHGVLYKCTTRGSTWSTKLKVEEEFEYMLYKSSEKELISYMKKYIKRRKYHKEIYFD